MATVSRLIKKDDIASSRAIGEADGDPGDKILEAATRLFCREGIHATGVDRILAEAGTAKMTLYKRFGSKEGLVHEVLKREGDQWRAWFFEELGASGGDARQRLVAVFDVLAQWFERDDYYGCAFINAVAEHDKSDEAIRRLALDHKRQMFEVLRGLAVDAGAAEAEAEVLAHQIGLLIDGAIVAALVTGNSRPARTARAAAEVLVAVVAGRRRTATRPAARARVRPRAARPG